MAITLYDTTDQVLQYLYSTNSSLRPAIEEYCEKIYGRHSGVNSLSSMSQLVIDDFIEKIGDKFCITPAGEAIMLKYGSYSAYRKTIDEKIAAKAVLAPDQLKSISDNTVDRKTIGIFTLIVLVLAVIGIILAALHHKG